MSDCPGFTGRANWRCPDGRLVLRYDAPREEWLRYRSLGIGSSDASAVLGVNRWTSAYEVWAEKRGLLAPQPDNDAMDMGRRLEPIVLNWWSEQAGIPIRRAGLMRSRTHPWQQASVDALAACGGIVEGKTLTYRVAEEWADGQTPDHAEAQSQHQMAVTGRSHTHVVGLQDGRTWLERLVVRDDQLIADLTKVEAEFWAWVQEGVEPPIDGSEATTEVLKNRWPGDGEEPIELGSDAIDLRERLRTIKQEAKALAEAENEVANQLRALLGNATRALLPDGSSITCVRNGTFQSKRFAAERPDLVAEFTRPSPALDVNAIKAERPEIYQMYRARVLRTPPPTTRKSKEK